MCVVSGVGATHWVPATHTPTLRPTRYLYSTRVGGNQLTPACHIIYHKYLIVVWWWINGTWMVHPEDHLQLISYYKSLITVLLFVNYTITTKL